MKKLILSIAFATLLLSGFAQDSLRTKPRNNEFGIDITGFIKQFISLNFHEYPEYYSPTYYLTYRHHFKPGNIRFAIGGNYSNIDRYTTYIHDKENYRYKTGVFDIRIGWEFYNNLGKRWQVYYGLDFKPSYYYIKDDASNWLDGYAIGYESKTQTYGLSPLLGFKFKILKRLSISTEASFSFYIQQKQRRDFYTPEDPSLPPKSDEVSPITNDFYTSFRQPISVFIAFDF